MHTFVRKFPIIGLAILLLGSGFFAQAADVPVTEEYCKSIDICGSASKEFTMIMDFSQELINAIHTIGTQGEYTGKPVNPNRFQGDTFAPPKQNIISKVTRNVAQKLNFIAAVTAIVVSPQQGGGLKDLFAGTLTLFKNKIFGRDLQLVEKLDASLTQKRYEIGLGGGTLAVVINDANVTKIQKILDSYKEKGLLADSSISAGVTYTNLTTMIGRILSAMKSFLSVNTTDQFSAGGNIGGMSLKFDSAAIQSMTKQYLCARSTNNVCDNSYKQFSKNMKRLGKDTLSGAQKSIDTFVDAAKRLTQLFSKNPSSELKARENELLDTYYGTQKRKTGLINATADDGGALKSLQQVGQQFSGMFANRRTATIESESKNTNKISQLTVTPASTIATGSTEFAAWIANSMSSFPDDQQRDLQMATFSEVKDITILFNTIGQQIAAAKGLLGSKDENGTLIKELGEACELQCGGKGQKCW